jgi:hypothetical protein
MPFIFDTRITGKQQVCVFVPQKLPRLCRGKLAFAPGGCKGLFGFPGDFGAMGQDSIVGQSFILLNAKTHFFGLTARSVCGTNVHLANLEKAIY